MFNISMMPLYNTDGMIGLVMPMSIPADSSSSNKSSRIIGTNKIDLLVLFIRRSVLSFWKNAMPLFCGVV